MRPLSKDNLDRLHEEIQLLSNTIASVEQQRNRLVLEYGIENIRSATATLYAERLLLQLKADALHDFLTR